MRKRKLGEFAIMTPRKNGNFSIRAQFSSILLNIILFLTKYLLYLVSVVPTYKNFSE